MVQCAVVRLRTLKHLQEKKDDGEGGHHLMLLASPFCYDAVFGSPSVNTIDRDIDAVDAVPPIVERGREQHLQHAQAQDEKAQRRPEPQHCRKPISTPQRSAQHHRQRDQSAERDRRIHHCVRRNPEAVAPDRNVPEQIPGIAESAEQRQHRQRADHTPRSHCTVGKSGDICCGGLRHNPPYPRASRQAIIRLIAARSNGAPTSRMMC